MIQKARNLGKDVFSEMGPDGEDALFTFLKASCGLGISLASYKPLADTGNYPGQQEIVDGLTLIRALLACDDSFKFIERFNERKDDLLDFPTVSTTWSISTNIRSRRGKSSARRATGSSLNRLELERDEQAGPGLATDAGNPRATSPYGIIKEAEGLITRSRRSTQPWSDRTPHRGPGQDRRAHCQVEVRILRRLTRMMARSARQCLRPLETLRSAS